MSEPLTITLDRISLEALDKLAKRTGRSREVLAADAIEAYVSSNDWQLEKIKAGLEAAKRREFADDKEVERVRAKFASAK